MQDRNSVAADGRGPASLVPDLARSVPAFPLSENFAPQPCQTPTPGRGHPVDRLGGQWIALPGIVDHPEHFGEPLVDLHEGVTDLPRVQAALSNPQPV